MQHIYWAIGIFGTVFFAVILFAIVYKLLEYKAAAKWSATDGTVIESRTVARKVIPNDFDYDSGGESNVRNYAHVKYKYVVGGRQYHCDRVSVAEPAADFEIEETLARYPVGTAVTVFYNPAKPGQAVLERDIPAMMWFGIPLVLGLFGGGPLFLFAITGQAADWLKPLVVNPDRVPAVVMLTV